MNCYGNSALHEAAHEGHTEVIELLLKSGAEVNVRNHKGSTPLSFFCYNSDKESHPESTLRMLLTNGAHVGATNGEGMTALLCAATAGRNDLISALMDFGACPTAKDSAGRSASDIADFHGYPDLMQRFGPLRLTHSQCPDHRI